MENAQAGRFGGFTLIELLVVVLIIGILAAVAMPQYEKAVRKSRFAALIPLMRSVAQAEDAYFMANGKYSSSIQDLDVDLPFVSSSFNGKGTFYQLSNGSTVYLSAHPDISSIQGFAEDEDRSVYLEYYFEFTRDTSFGKYFSSPMVCWGHRNIKKNVELCRFFSHGAEMKKESYGFYGYDVPL